MPVPNFSPYEVLTSSNMNKVGLWLIETKSVTTASEITFDNVFTSNYLNYLVIMSVSGATSTDVISWQERAGGVNAASSYSYVGATYYLSAGSAFQSLIGGQNITAGGVGKFSGASGSQGHCAFEIHSPNTSAYTSVTSRFSFSTGNTGIDHGTVGSTHYVVNVYDGFRLFVGSGNFTATVRVYGIRN